MVPNTYGDLLTAKGRAGVKVRLLVWYSDNLRSGHHAADNVHDMGLLGKLPLRGLPDTLSAPSTESMSRDDRLKARAEYCHTWWTFALRGKFTNVEVRL